MIVGSIVTFVRSHADPWLLPILFLASAAEASLFVGLVFPGETLLLLAGYLAWRGDVPLVLAVLATVLGAAFGDSIGYELGRRYGRSLRRSRVGRRISEARWRKADRWFEEHGGSSVFLGRFVTGPKALVPALAGESHMAYRRFLLWNVSSAVLWGSFHVGIGYLAGPSWRAVEHSLRLVAFAVAGAAAAVAGLLWWRHRHAARRSAAPDSG